MTTFYPLVKREADKVIVPAPPLDPVERTRWSRLFHNYLNGQKPVEFDYNQKYEVDHVSPS